jgi:pilus assembly protein CpaE
MRNRRTARGAASVVVVGVDSIGMGLIRECLGTEAVLPTHATPYEEAAQVVRKTRPNVVVMGFDVDFDEAVRLGQDLTAESNSLHMVAISSRTDPERIRAAMRAGYREFVVLPEDSDLLRRAVHESASDESTEGDVGELIAFVGTKGGAGVSLLAVNMAAELSAIERVALIDLDFSMGDIAAFLDLEPSNSIHDVLRDLDRIDERMLAGSVTVHPSKVHVLAQPTELVDHDEVHGEDVMRVLSVAARAYQHVLVDCGTRVDEATLTTTSVADTIILVTTPDVVAVRNAWRRVQLMERIGIDKGVIRLVVNKWGRQNELRIADIESNLQLKVAATITRDDHGCAHAVNKGQLLRTIAPRSPALRDIGMALDLLTGDAAVVTTGGSKSFWGGLFGG